MQPISFLFSTDNHLGYRSDDTIRMDDAYRTVEEVLKRAVEENVDFVLFGGIFSLIQNR